MIADADRSRLRGCDMPLDALPDGLELIGERCLP
jgi:hypothetical protein